MSSRTPSQKINTKHVSKRPAKLNKAQQRALQVRASETRWDDSQAVVGGSVAAEATGEATLSSSAVSVAPKVRRRTIQQPAFLLSRAQELAFIRSDMRRLVTIASVLLVVMLVLLFIVD